MPLEEYHKKRNFSQTSEPKGGKGKKDDSLIFVIQRHSASRLHYDFRLEMQGVLKSWAIPKGPSLDPQDKRLAMQTEDHPYSYKDFEGSIPKGNYGAGEVEIWDSGTYEPLNTKKGKSKEASLLEELQSGSIKINLHGQKLKGEFALVKIKNSKEGNAWLLIKHNDTFATQGYNAEDFAAKDSKVSERELNRASTGKASKVQKKTPVKNFSSVFTASERFSSYISPMLAETGERAFDDKKWLFEIKWDGYRGIADLREDKIKLYSRNGISYAASFEKIVKALEDQKYPMVLDGEIVAFNAEGKPEFQLLQNKVQNSKLALSYQVFDLLWLNGHSTQKLSLIERKELLKEALIENEVVKYCDHVEEKGKDFFKQVETLGLEGMIAKKMDSLYLEGIRTEDWLKIKFHKTQEVLICGYTEPKAGRSYFGSLIMGIYEKGALCFCGHVGTGFKDDTLKNLREVFRPLETDECPFEEVPKTNGKPTWLRPELICEIKFTEKTKKGIFRHPVYLGIRADKDLEDLEEFEDSNARTSKLLEGTKSKREVKLTNQKKVYFPESGITKGDLIAYYQSVAEYILPHLKHRPQSLNRFPNGIEELNFYHKDAGKEAPTWMDKVSILSESNDKDNLYLIGNTKEDLAYLNNLGCIDLNPWNSTVDHLHTPTWLALDLDPSENNTFEHVIETAMAVKEVLDLSKVKGYAKTSGSSGIHIYLPMEAKYSFEQVKNFAHILMQKVNQLLPELTTLERNLKKRGKEKIYLDYLQNRFGQTLASVYSVRPKPHAPVSMPLNWNEVKSGLSPTDFTIHSALERIKKKGDLFKPVLGEGIDLLDALENLSPKG
ncbi:DNA ligase D [Chryseobacterium sp. A321]